MAYSSWPLIKKLDNHWPMCLVSRKGVVSVMPEFPGGISETALSNYLGAFREAVSFCCRHDQSLMTKLEFFYISNFAEKRK